MPEPANIFVAKDGQEIGPLTATEFEERHRRLDFRVLDPAWREGMPGWSTVGNLMFLINRERAGLAAPPAPSATPPTAPEGAPGPDAVRQRAEELHRRRQALLERVVRVRVLPCLPKEDYKTVGPIALSLGNKGMFADHLNRLIDKHRKLLQDRQVIELSGSAPASPLRRLNIPLGPTLTGAVLLEAAYLLGVEELRERAALLGGNALVDVSHRTECDLPGSQAFCIHLSGTVVLVAGAEADEIVAAEAAARAGARDAIQAMQKSGAGGITPDAQAALDALQLQLHKQQEAIRLAREELTARERFLEESETRLFEKFQEQQVRETELDMREDRINARDKATKS